MFTNKNNGAYINGAIGELDNYAETFNKRIGYVKNIIADILQEAAGILSDAGDTVTAMHVVPEAFLTICFNPEYDGIATIAFCREADGDTIMIGLTPDPDAPGDVLRFMSSFTKCCGGYHEVLLHGKDGKPVWKTDIETEIDVKGFLGDDLYEYVENRTPEGRIILELVWTLADDTRDIESTRKKIRALIRKSVPLTKLLDKMQTSLYPGFSKYENEIVLHKSGSEGTAITAKNGKYLLHQCRYLNGVFYDEDDEGPGLNGMPEYDCIVGETDDMEKIIRLLKLYEGKDAEYIIPLSLETVAIVEDEDDFPINDRHLHSVNGHNGMTKQEQASRKMANDYFRSAGF